MGDLEEAKVYVGNVIGKDLLGNDMFVFKEAGFVKGDIKVERPKFKNGDFVKSTKGNICIYHSTNDRGGIISYAGTAEHHITFKTDNGWGHTKDFRLATESEKQELLNDLKENGKRWNEEKLCIEGIPKFKEGDKVMLKKDCINGEKGLYYLKHFDYYIGQELTVSCYSKGGSVNLNGLSYYFPEEWLEPYIEEPKQGDLCIFWDNTEVGFHVRRYNGKMANGYFRDNNGIPWQNAVKLDVKEQFEKNLKR